MSCHFPCFLDIAKGTLIIAMHTCHDSVRHSGNARMTKSSSSRYHGFNSTSLLGSHLYRRGAP